MSTRGPTDTKRARGSPAQGHQEPAPIHHLHHKGYVEDNKESLTPERLSATNKGDNTRGDLKNTLQQHNDILQDGHFARRRQEGMTGSITVGGVEEV